MFPPSMVRQLTDVKKAKRQAGICAGNDELRRAEMSESVVILIPLEVYPPAYAVALLDDAGGGSEKRGDAHEADICQAVISIMYRFAGARCEARG